jgi:hypothetical protein
MRMTGGGAGGCLGRVCRVGAGAGADTGTGANDERVEDGRVESEEVDLIFTTVGGEGVERDIGDGAVTSDDKVRAALSAVSGDERILSRYF